MKFEIIRASAAKGKPKATIHLTGKLGFNMEAYNLMELKQDTKFLFARDTEDENKFYLLHTEEDEGSIRAAKAGSYFYLNMASVFDQIGFNYAEQNYSFYIKKDKYEGKDIFVLEKRPVTPRKDMKGKKED